MKIRNNLYCCGDHLLNGSINAAMKSGRLLADLIILGVIKKINSDYCITAVSNMAIFLKLF
jgi:hypothetical protein